MPEPSSDKLIALLTTPNRTTLDRAKSILENEGIVALIDDEAISTWFGDFLGSSQKGTHLKVLESDLDNAKRILCEQGIRCEVFSAWVEQFIEHVFKPALKAKTLDFQRILDLLQSQTTETRQSLFARLAGQEGGADFLTKILLASLVKNWGEEAVRRDIAGGLTDSNEETLAASLQNAIASTKERAFRIRLVRTLGRLKSRWSALLLIELLEDPNVDVRNEALDSLYFLSQGFALGFEPEGSPDDRAPAVKRWQKWAESWKT